MSAKMTITKYPQSCLKIEKAGGTILVDPGTVATAQFGLNDFGHVDAVIYTHSHADHFDDSIIDELIESGALLYGNSDVARKCGEAKVEEVDPGEELVIAGFQVKTFKMDHCLMVDGSKGVPNTGYLLDGRLLLPGDSVEVGGVKAEVLAAPIFGPDISLHDAYTMSQNVGAKVVIPVHYDIAGMDPGVYQILGGQHHPQAKIKILGNGESAEL